MGDLESLSCTASHQEGGCNATWEREFSLPWREASPPNHHDDEMDSDQEVVNNKLSLLEPVGTNISTAWY